MWIKDLKASLKKRLCINCNKREIHNFGVKDCYCYYCDKSFYDSRKKITQTTDQDTGTSFKRYTALPTKTPVARNLKKLIKEKK